VLLLNNDTIIDKNMINNCVRYMEEQPDVAVINPKLYFYHKPQHIYMVGAELNMASEIIFMGWNQRDIGQYDQEREINFAHGSALLARTTVFERVGLFDERLFCYGEDVELSRRISMAGMKMIYYPKAKVWHKCESMEFESKGVLSNRLSTYYMWRNRLFSIRYYLIERRIQGYCAFLFGFVRRFASFALKYRRFDLCGAMLLGLIDALVGRMGKREYAYFEVPVAHR
jgi:GT2 family glycosyltransferase